MHTGICETGLFCQVSLESNIFHFPGPHLDIDKFRKRDYLCGTFHFPGNHSMVGYTEIHSTDYFSVLLEKLNILQAFLPKKEITAVAWPVTSRRRAINQAATSQRLTI